LRGGAPFSGDVSLRDDAQITQPNADIFLAVKLRLIRLTNVTDEQINVSHCIHVALH
jgi:hypothetical protein